MKILFSSGYSNDTGGLARKLDPDTFLQKPYALGEPAAKVRELLDTPTATGATRGNQSEGDASSSRTRPASVRRSRTDTAGSFSRILTNGFRARTRHAVSVSATMVADRGAPSTSAISPK